MSETLGYLYLIISEFRYIYQNLDIIRYTHMVAHRTVPPVSVRTTVLPEGAYSVVRIDVPQSRSIIATSQGRMLRRRLKANGEPESIPMFPYEIATRPSDLGRLDYSAQPIPDTTREDFDPVAREYLRNLIRKYGNSDKSLLELGDEELEKALGFVSTVEDRELPTVAGLLMIGREEAIAKHIPTAGSVLQVLSGTDIKVNLEYTGSLLRSIEQIADAIEPWNPITEMSMGLFSDPVRAFNKRAVREALVNAFGHRNRITGQP